MRRRYKPRALSFRPPPLTLPPTGYAFALSRGLNLVTMAASAAGVVAVVTAPRDANVRLSELGLTPLAVAEPWGGGGKEIFLTRNLSRRSGFPRLGWKVSPVTLHRRKTRAPATPSSA